MKVQTEIAIRGILQMDAEVVKADMDRAINILNGRHDEDDDLVHVIRRKDAMKWLGVHRRTLDYYLRWATSTACTEEGRERLESPAKATSDSRRIAPLRLSARRGKGKVRDRRRRQKSCPRKPTI